jgi:hypothetical protein
MLIRTEDGREGLVPWRKLQKEKGGPVRLTWGYALTIDTAQGMTVRDAIGCFPSGTGAIPIGKHYTAGSRHEQNFWMFISESAERQQISRGRVGGGPTISYEDIWASVAKNMARAAEKTSALDLVRQTAASARGYTRTRLSGLEKAQRYGREATRAVMDRLERTRLHRAYSRVRESFAPSMRRGPEMYRDRGGPRIEL